MELYKLSQGSTFENLKHFIYLTNEYGVPSTEFVDDFINQFGKGILNSNFSISPNQLKQLDLLWDDIVKDCEYNNVKCTNTYGNIFYIVLDKKALYKIKEDWEETQWYQLTEEDKLELLKQFILNFDGYIKANIAEAIEIEDDEMVTYTLDFNKTPELIKEDSFGKYIDCTFISNGHERRMRLYEDCRCMVLKDAFLEDIKPSASNTVRNNRIKYEVFIEKDKLTSNLMFRTPSGASSFCYGSETVAWSFIKNSNGQPISIYRNDQEDNKDIDFMNESRAHLKQTSHTSITKAAMRREELSLVTKDDNDNIIDKLILNTATGHVFVEKSPLEELVNEDLDSFETYIMMYCISKYISDTVIDKYDTIMEYIKQGKIWEVQIGKFYKPLNIIFNW